MKIKTFEWISIAAALVLPSSASIAAEVTLSHTFTPGTPAKADEVNQNFTDIKTSVNDNHNRISANETATSQNSASISTNTAAIDSNASRISANETALAASQQPISIYDASNNRLGRYIGVVPLIGTSYSKWVHQGVVAWILSDNGYLMPLQRTYGITVASLRGLDYFQLPTIPGDYTINIATVYYESNNCTGQEYLSADQLDAIAYAGFSPVISIRGGIVFQATEMSGTKVVSYLPKDNNAVPIAYQSSRAMNETTCSANPKQLLEYALAFYPNDPTITAVSDKTTYSWPLTFH